MSYKRIMLGAGIVITLAMFVIFTNTPIRAQGEGADSAVAGKLDEVVKNQKKILQGLDEIKAELNVIKIRVSQQQ